MFAKSAALFVYTWITLYLVLGAGGTCHWPSEFANSVWEDERGALEFTSTGMSGWVLSYIVKTVQTISNWSCNDTSLYSSMSLIVMKANNLIAFSNNDYIGFLCLHLTKLTDVSYRYYIYSPIQQGLEGSPRATMINASFMVTDTFTQICYSGLERANVSESGVWIKAGSASSAAVLCPYSLLARYTFKYTKTDVCNENDVGAINICDVKTQMEANTTCGVLYPLYAGSSTSRCVDVVVSSSSTYVTLHNDVTSSNTFTYSCVAISSDGKSMSVTPNYCKKGQTPTAVPVRNDFHEEGSVLALTIDGPPCPPCPSLTNPLHGSHNITVDGAITKAKFTCDTGFSLSGNDTRVCQVNGLWTGATLSCTCPTPPDPANGSVTVSGDGLTANYICDTGYIIIGSKTQTCNAATNTWGGSAPICNKCDTLTTPSNGNVTLTSDGVTTYAQFVCADQYFIQGSATSSCFGSGKWSNEVPVCFACENLTAPSNGNVTLTNDSVTSYAQFVCAEGYFIQGNTMATCLSSGKWSNGAPVCSKCDNLTAPSNGNLTLTSDGVTSYAKFVCADRYFIQGNVTSTCLSSGKWSNEAPVCYCSDPVVPSHGAFVVNKDRLLVEYTCITNYSLKGARTRYCMDQGRGWSDSDPECVQCSTISPPSDGKLSSAVSNGTFTIATFQCNKGTTMKGGDMAVCLDTGNWSPPTPTCVKCADPPNLGTGSYAYISDGKITSLTVMCEVGSTVSGSVNGRCDTNGTWIFATSMSASCASCGAPPDPVGGSFKLMTNGTSTRGELMCNTGYVIQGGSASVLDCLSNGSWSQSSSSSAECVPLKSVAEASGSDRLLPAVIALAVLCGVLVVAVGALVIKVVKWRTDKGVTKNGHAQVNGFPVSHAPFDHSQHVMDNRVVPPLFKTKTDLDSFRSKPDSTTTQTTSRMTTAVSSGNLLLHLIKETTSSSIYHDQPSPWNVVSFRGKEGTPSNDHSNHLGQEHDVDKKSKKHKKRSKKKLLQGTTSYDLGRTTPITSRTSPSVERTPRTVPVQSREHSSLGRPGQSTTPALQHHIGTSAQHELNTTPRSGLIPTVHQ